MIAGAFPSYISLCQNPDWKVQEGVREVAANWIDALKTFKADVVIVNKCTDIVFYYESRDPASNALLGTVIYDAIKHSLSFKNAGHMDIRCLNQSGFTTKRRDGSTIGKFGDGLKAAIAAFCRHNKIVHVDTKSWGISADADKINQIARCFNFQELKPDAAVQPFVMVTIVNIDLAEVDWSHFRFLPQKEEISDEAEDELDDGSDESSEEDAGDEEDEEFVPRAAKPKKIPKPCITTRTRVIPVVIIENATKIRQQKCEILPHASHRGKVFQYGNFVCYVHELPFGLNMLVPLSGEHRDRNSISESAVGLIRVIFGGLDATKHLEPKCINYFIKLIESESMSHNDAIQELTRYFSTEWRDRFCLKAITNYTTRKERR